MKTVILGAPTVLALLANPRFYTDVPALADLKPRYDELQTKLRTVMEVGNGTQRGCSACTKRKVTLDIYTQLVAAFFQKFLAVYNTSPADLQPLLAYFQADSVELPVKTGPKIIIGKQP